ncbi:hypothetical protein GCM10011319_47960 [Mameliella alba]|nr:hypothetical protein GCM10011319_47960 [Mameliella alba]
MTAGKLFLICAIPGMVGIICFQQLQVWDKKGVARSLDAQLSFFAEAANLNCLRANQIKELARARRWHIAEPDPRFYNSGPVRADASMRIFTEPPMPFSKETGIRFLFDENGCWIVS